MENDAPPPVLGGTPDTLEARAKAAAADVVPGETFLACDPVMLREDVAFAMCAFAREYAAEVESRVAWNVGTAAAIAHKRDVARIVEAERDLAAAREEIAAWRRALREVVGLLVSPPDSPSAVFQEEVRHAIWKARTLLSRPSPTTKENKP